MSARFAKPPTQREAGSRPAEGQFGGYAGGGGSGGGGGSSGGWEQSELDDPKNYSIYVVKPGDYLTKIARTRQGLRMKDLAWLNGISADKPLRIGQKLKLPTQAYLEFTKERFLRIQALGAYLVVNGALPVPKSPDDRNFHDIDTSHPPNAAAIVAATRKTVTVNGYAFDHDVLRTWRAFGYLALGPTAKRSGRAQSSAGGANRLPSDHGGHFISSIFNGPGSAINLFPQDARFNQSDYKKLEIGWRNDLQAGRRVYVDISASYTGLSKRPEAITVVWYVNGKRRMRTFQNGPKGK